MTSAGGLVVRAPLEHEFDVFTNCIETAFTMRLNDEERDHFIEHIDPARCLAGYVDGELVGTLVTRRLELTLPGLVAFEVSGVTEAAVLPTHRRQGVLSAMLDRYFAELHEAQLALSMLSASEGTIYGRFGYGPAIYMADYLIERRASAFSSMVPRQNGRIRLLSVEESKEALPALFDLARRQRVGEVHRPSDWWGELFRTRSRSDAPRYVASFEQDGELSGYVVYDIERALGHERELIVRELVSASPETYRELWSYLFGVDLVTRIRAPERPLDEPLRHLFDDLRALKVERVMDRSWLRLVEVPAALEARRYSATGRIVLSLIDERCPWNTGTYEIEVGNGGLCSIEATDAPFELEFRASELASCYFGATRASALATAGRVREVAPGAAERFDVLFGVDPPPFCTALD